MLPYRYNFIFYFYGFTRMSLLFKAILKFFTTNHLFTVLIFVSETLYFSRPTTFCGLQNENRKGKMGDVKI